MILVGEAGRLYPLSWRIPPSWKMATPTSPGYAALISSHHQLSGIARNFDLQPYRVTAPAGQFEFVLPSESRVDVFLNGRRIEQLRLAPGRYDVRDFPFTQGGNDVRLEITDDVGRVSTLDLGFTFDSDLLAPSLHEYAYSIGLPSFNEEGLRKYERSFPSVTAFHRLGVTETLTLGANVQGDDAQQMLGGKSLWASPIGTFALNLAGSRMENVGAGFAAQAAYEYVDAGRAASLDRSLQANVTLRSPNFIALGDNRPTNAIALDAVTRYSQRLARDLTGGVGLSYQVGRGDRGDTHNVNVFLRYTFSPRLSADLRLDRDRDTDGRDEYRAFLSVFWRLSDDRQFVQSSHDTVTETTRFDWQYAPERDVRTPFGNVAFVRTRNQYEVGGDLFYNGYRMETSASHDVIDPRDDDFARDRRSSFRLAGALVFADGHLALSRPVTDSFAIVVGHPNLAGETIGINPIESDFRAEVDEFGPAVVHNLTPYQIELYPKVGDGMR